MRIGLGLGLSNATGSGGGGSPRYVVDQLTPFAAYTWRDGARLEYFIGKYWLLGGWSKPLPNGWSTTNAVTNEVWSSTDMIMWTKELAHDDAPPTSGAGARWGPRHVFMSWVFAGKLWVAGSDQYDPGGDVAPEPGLTPIHSDIWNSVDGITWVRVAASSAWGHDRGVYDCIPGQFGGYMHVMGGFRPDPNFPNASRTGWPTSREHWRSADGITWEQLPDMPFDRARAVNAVTLGNLMIIAGGMQSPAPITMFPDVSLNDVWVYDGSSWTQTSASAEWTVREWTGSAVYDGKLWVTTGYDIVGGANQGGLRWSDNLGATWNEVLHYKWTASHADGILATSNGIYVACGNQQGTNTFHLSRTETPDPGYFNPDVLSLTGWWRSAFASSPWPGQPSTGGDFTNSTATIYRHLTEATHPPVPGAMLNGYATADFNGTNALLSGALASSFFGSSWSLWWLFWADTAPVDPGATSPYTAPGISDASGAPIAIGITSSGLRAGYYDGATWGSVKVAAPVGQWHLARIRSDGTKVEMSIDGGSWSSAVRAGPYVPNGNALRVGTSYSAATFFDGRIADLGIAASCFNDITMDDVMRYINGRYGLLYPVLQPTISNITPSSGFAVGGTAITNLAGGGFRTGATVTFGSVAATSVVVVSDIKITCVAPAGAAGTADVVVTNTNGETSGATGAGIYTYVSAPTISSVSPTVGTESGGTAITITGTAFLASPAVTVGGVTATSIVRVNSTTITCVSPAGSVTGSKVNIVVTNTDSQAVTSTSAYQYLPGPDIANTQLAIWRLDHCTLDLSNTYVNTVLDLSGQGDSARNLAKVPSEFGPVYNATEATYNNKPSATFGNLERLLTGVWSSPVTQPYTLLVVGNCNHSGSAWFFMQGIDEQMYLIETVTTQLRLDCNAGGGGIESAGYTDGVPSLIWAKCNGASSALSLNNRAATASGNAGPNGFTGLVLGNRFDGDAHLNGPLLEVRVIHGTLSPTDLTSLLNYARDLYAIPLDPVLTSLNYDLADTAGGDHITITGTNIAGATACKVGVTSATITANTGTSLTFTMPAKASGTYNVVVTTAQGDSNALTIEAFNPTDLASVTGDWPASFTASPWVGLVGGFNFTEGTNPPSVGTAVNTFTPAHFDGVNDKLASGNESSLFGASAYTAIALIKVAAFTLTDPGAAAPYSCPNVLGDGGGGNGAPTGGPVGSGGSGVFRYGHYDGAWHSASTAISTATWTMVKIKYDGSLISVGTNGGSYTTVSSGNPTTEGYQLTIGGNYGGGAFFSGDVLHALTANTALSDANVTKIRKYFNARYGLSL